MGIGTERQGCQPSPPPRSKSDGLSLPGLEVKSKCNTVNIHKRLLQLCTVAGLREEGGPRGNLCTIVGCQVQTKNSARK